MKRALTTWTILLVTASAAWAQEMPEQGEVVASPAPADANQPAPTPLESSLLPLPEAGLIYSSQGRRDPFVSLIRPAGPARTTGVRKAGIEGFVIQEVALKGIVRTGPGQLVALLEGPDKKTYFTRVGQRLHDGRLVAIDATTATFRQVVDDPLSSNRSREVKKSLYPSEEARQ